MLLSRRALAGAASSTSRAGSQSHDTTRTRVKPSLHSPSGAICTNLPATYTSTMRLSQGVVQAFAGLLLYAMATQASNAEPVRVDFYMEALCPYCANFTLTQLQPLFANKLINFVELDVIPYGNARFDEKTGRFTCQHGPLECELNKLIGCAIAQHPIQDDWFPFLTCIEETVVESRARVTVEEVAAKCAVHAGMVTDRLLSCHHGELGTSLQRLAAQRTAGLKPAHQYVPWVVVNGIPLLEDDENILRYICVAYTGRDRPSVCYDMPKPAAQPVNQVSQKGEGKLPQQQKQYTRCVKDHGSMLQQQLLQMQR